jgi:hypothetical protein
LAASSIGRTIFPVASIQDFPFLIPVFYCPERLCCMNPVARNA